MEYKKYWLVIKILMNTEHKDKNCPKNEVKVYQRIRKSESKNAMQPLISIKVVLFDLKLYLILRKICIFILVYIIYYQNWLKMNVLNYIYLIGLM